jgi:hypothetical protein
LPIWEGRTVIKSTVQGIHKDITRGFKKREEVVQLMEGTALGNMNMAD